MIFSVIPEVRQYADANITFMSSPSGDDLRRGLSVAGDGGGRRPRRPIVDVTLPGVDGAASIAFERHAVNGSPTLLLAAASRLA
ncbi:hypothetical protein [Nitrogeniibacter aestuarii]|uniref:hypothetical protein n=1 Tax=Nitrogeniibacter aestuarii TaxID=2815343 RepID=UPI001D0F9C31|nr:hypothetical protein [Nitrogeniibacter aestuarii]